MVALVPPPSSPSAQPSGASSSGSAETETIVLGGGCFWCTEAVFTRVDGVLSVQSGYAGGHTDSPDYRAICSGTTGHAEVVRVEFDPRRITLEDILQIFFATHDPTTLNRQGADVGTQYRSVIFASDASQRDRAQAVIDRLQHGDAQNDAVFDEPIVTELAGPAHFWPAEAYHNRYHERNGGERYCQLVIDPKLARLRRGFASRLRPGA